MLTVGWMPGYLIWNITGPQKYRGQNVNHFSPTAVFFKPEEYWMIVQTDIAFLSALALFAYSIHTFGFLAVAKYYILPYMVVNYHLVLITFLQHTDVYMPHFRGEEWDWLRGALCTVDRSFGPLLDHTFHHIVDTHVCHHLFSKMPFYHAQEATEAMRKVLGPYYMKDETPIAQALYRSFSTCLFVEDEGNVVFYKNLK
jgi:omega-6 fatty acid desaturase (delta-12 desaturase)